MRGGSAGIVPSSARLSLFLLRRLVGLLRAAIIVINVIFSSPRSAASAFVRHHHHNVGSRPIIFSTSSRDDDGRRRLVRVPSSSRRARREEGGGANSSVDDLALAPPPPPDPSSSSTTTTGDRRRLRLSASDVAHMRRAVALARIGYGNTYPNPAVGCVIVRHDEVVDVVVGSGFHPRAGWPHAEVFALFEACGLVDDGVAAARSVMTSSPRSVDDDDDDDDDDGASPAAGGGSSIAAVSRLLDAYASTTNGGATDLFGGCFADMNVTAYVTLEPCCHVGRTPPCASSLVVAGVRRVVVGCRDPNPRVDGGGMRVLADAGIDVRVLGDGGGGGGVVGVGVGVGVGVDEECVSSYDYGEMDAAAECRDLIKYFVKRISPRPTGSTRNLDDVVDGRRRRALRSIAGRMKNDGTMRQIEWPGGKKIVARDEDDDNDGDDAKDGDWIDVARRVPIDVGFLEAIDGILWDHEMVLLRLNGAVRKKGGAKVLSGRVAEILDAHVAQVIGHTALLYRPAIPPILDLDELVDKMED